jgi:hypothetical protein
LYLSVFFRGFRGHNIHHYQIETVLGNLSIDSSLEQSDEAICKPLITNYEIAALRSQ